MQMAARRRRAQRRSEQRQVVTPEQRELAIANLYQFFLQAWEELEPGNDLHTNWIQELICEYLMAVFYGQINKLLINIAPRHLKSRLASVCLPDWAWLKKPQTRFLCLSFASSLAIDHNYDRRRLIQSDWYQQLSGGLDLSFAKNRLSEFGNSQQGAMIARGFDGAVTGVGGDFLIVDDPNDPENVESETVRASTLKKFKGYSSTRKNDPNAPIVVIQQRTHTDDVSAYIMKELGYETLILPTEAEEHQVLYFPLSPERSPIIREVGDLLDPDRFGVEANAEAKTTLGSYMYAARHQQRPVPIEGGMVKLDWFQRYTVAPFKPEKLIASADTASKANAWNAPWAIGLWAVWQGNYYLLEVFRKRMEYPEGKRTFGNLLLKWQPTEVLIEDKSTGQNLIQEFKQGVEDSADKKHFFNIIAIQPDGDKVTRMSVESSAIEAGRVWLPEVATWLPDYEAEVGTFPLAATADQVDMTSQFLKRMRLTSTIQQAPKPRPATVSPKSLREIF
jgi:predicted phage terminase large subunit-like protein